MEHMHNKNSTSCPRKIWRHNPHCRNVTRSRNSISLSYGGSDKPATSDAISSTPPSLTDSNGSINSSSNNTSAPSKDRCSLSQLSTLSMLPSFPSGEHHHQYELQQQQRELAEYLSGLSLVSQLPGSTETSAVTEDDVVYNEEAGFATSGCHSRHLPLRSISWDSLTEQQQEQDDSKLPDEKAAHPACNDDLDENNRHKTAEDFVDHARSATDVRAPPPPYSASSSNSNDKRRTQQPTLPHYQSDSCGDNPQPAPISHQAGYRSCNPQLSTAPAVSAVAPASALPPPPPSLLAPPSPVDRNVTASASSSSNPPSATTTITAKTYNCSSSNSNCGPMLPLFYKTHLCRSFEQQDSCPYTHRCMFAHGAKELRTVEQNEACGLINEVAIYKWQRRLIRQANREHNRNEAAANHTADKKATKKNTAKQPAE